MIYEDLFVINSLGNCLTKEEIAYYFQKYKQGDLEARNTIINHNIKLVISEVTKKFYATPYELKELISVGIIGLIKSVDTFDFLRNFEFSTYAVRCIDNEILMFMRKELKYTSTESLERSIDTSKDGDDIELKSTIEYHNNSYNSDYDYINYKLDVMKVINSLAEFDRKIIMLYFGFYNNRSYTQVEISNMLNVSRKLISNIIKKNMYKIQEMLLEQKIGDIDDRVKVNKKTIKK